MRKSVITGVFACALVFAISGDKTEAASVDSIEIKNAGIELSLVTKSDDHPLAEFSEDKDTSNKKTEAKKPTKHVVKPGESLEKIAKNYDIDWKKIFYKNTAIKNPDQIKVGSTVEIPEKGEKLTERELPEPVIVEPVVERTDRRQNTQPVTSSQRQAPAVNRSTVTRGSSSGNLYVAGYCTWYVKNQRPDLPNNLGNAYTWVSRAAAQGMATGSTPRAGAVGQRGNHVVYVQSVNSDGTVTISEMNHKGLYVRTVRTLPASYFTYIY